MFGTPQSRDISELEDRISDAVESVTRDILTKVWKKLNISLTSAM
jgi:hypothetical protein